MARICLDIIAGRLDLRRLASPRLDSLAVPRRSPDSESGNGGPFDRGVTIPDLTSVIFVVVDDVSVREALELVVQKQIDELLPSRLDPRELALR
jgi:hypothetical protein